MGSQRFYFVPLTIIITLLLAGCSDNTNTPQDHTALRSSNSIASEVTSGTTVQADYIELTATLLPDSAPGTTQISLAANNHRDNLATLDWVTLALLDGVSATSWEITNTAMGGHHVEGILTFPIADSPTTLSLSEMPGGSVLINLN